MIRRKASLIGTGEGGFVLAWLVTETSGSQDMFMAFEYGAIGPEAGKVKIVPADNVRFTDGSPDVIPTIE